MTGLRQKHNEATGGDQLMIKRRAGSEHGNWMVAAHRTQHGQHTVSDNHHQLLFLYHFSKRSMWKKQSEGQWQMKHASLRYSFTLRYLSLLISLFWSWLQISSPLPFKFYLNSNDQLFRLPSPDNNCSRTGVVKFLPIPIQFLVCNCGTNKTSSYMYMS